MVQDRGELVRRYEQSRAALLAAIEGLSDELLSERSLDGWSVSDHLAHLALWDEVRASEVARISAGFDSAWKMTDEQDDIYNDLGTELRRGFSPAQAQWELATTRQRLLDAIASASERGLDASLYGEAGLAGEHEAQHVAWIARWRAARV